MEVEGSGRPIRGVRMAVGWEEEEIVFCTTPGFPLFYSLLLGGMGIYFTLFGLSRPVLAKTCLCLVLLSSVQILSLYIF